MTPTTTSLDAATVRALVVSYESLADDDRPLGGPRGLLEWARAEGLRLAVVARAPREAVQKALARAALPADVLASTLPEALAGLGVQASEALLVAGPDAAAEARAAGVKHLVTRGAGRNPGATADWRREDSGFDRQLGAYELRRLVAALGAAPVLDVGCNDGALTAAIAERVGARNVVGIDPMEGAVAEAKRRHPHVEFHVGTLESFRTERRFGTLVVNSVLEHVPDAVGFLRRCRDLLVPGGTLLVTVPHAYSLHRRLGVAMGMLPDVHAFTPGDHAIGHQRVYDWPMLESHLKDAGFVVAERGGIFLKPLSNAQMEAWPKPIVDGLDVLGREMPDLATMLYAKCLKPAEGLAG
ncbi:MAG TPA: methyltransferase domain-containing protein [Candidatus Thermoplasmatota archaeon]|nr:methyltransferase domain-containing protein [Candidatus Thermoplasmatota archaeon]